MGVHIENTGNAAVVALRWPHTRNALGPAEAEEIAEAIKAAGNSDASAIVL